MRVFPLFLWLCFSFYLIVIQAVVCYNFNVIDNKILAGEKDT